MTDERINEISQNLDPKDFWGCLGWRTVAAPDKWLDVYKDNYYYLLITEFYGTPVKARFCDDAGGSFIVCGHSGSVYYSWDTSDRFLSPCQLFQANEILYVADIPSTEEVIKSINSICDKAEYWQSKYNSLLGLEKEE